MSATLFQIYPRGFLGALLPDSAQNHSSPYIANIDVKRFQSTARLALSAEKAPSNKVIDELFKTYVDNTYATTTFQFYERVLIAAHRAFGTTSFLEWLMAQKESGSADDLHSRFLRDTIDFIFTGKRQIMPDVWKMLLDGPTPSTPWTEVDLYFAKNLNPDLKSAGLLETKEYSLDNILYTWVRQENGITDLLKTLYICFGK